MIALRMVVGGFSIVMSGILIIKSRKKNNIKEWLDYKLNSIHFLLLAIWILK